MEKREYTYEGRLYQMLVPAVRQAMPLCNRVTVLLGPVVSTLKMDASGTSRGLEAFGQAIKSIDPAVLDSLLMDAMKTAKLCCHGAPISDPIPFEKHFGEYRGDVYPICIWCLWECVKDFFPQLGAFVQVAKAAAVKAFQSPPAGQSTIGSVDQSGVGCAPGPNSATVQ